MSGQKNQSAHPQNRRAAPQPYTMHMDPNSVVWFPVPQQPYPAPYMYPPIPPAYSQLPIPTLQAPSIFPQLRFPAQIPVVQLPLAQLPVQLPVPTFQTQSVFPPEGQIDGRAATSTGSDQSQPQFNQHQHPRPQHRERRRTVPWSHLQLQQPLDPVRMEQKLEYRSSLALPAESAKAHQQEYAPIQQQLLQNPALYDTLLTQPSLQQISQPFFQAPLNFPYAYPQISWMHMQQQDSFLRHNLQAQKHKKNRQPQKQSPPQQYLGQPEREQTERKFQEQPPQQEQPQQPSQPSPQVNCCEEASNTISHTQSAINVEETRNLKKFLHQAIGTSCGGEEKNTNNTSLIANRHVRSSSAPLLAWGPRDVANARGNRGQLLNHHGDDIEERSTNGSHANESSKKSYLRQLCSDLVIWLDRKEHKRADINLIGHFYKDFPNHSPKSNGKTNIEYVLSLFPKAVQLHEGILVLQPDAFRLFPPSANSSRDMPPLSVHTQAKKVEQARDSVSGSNKTAVFAQKVLNTKKEEQEEIDARTPADEENDEGFVELE